MRNKCSVAECDGKVKAKGLCNKHYQRVLKHGDLSYVKPPSFAQQFLLDAAKHASDDCLIWPYAKLNTGYGYCFHNGRMSVASRIVCELAHGSPPSEDYEAAHSCGKGHLGCVSPSHLRWATHDENRADMTLHGTTIEGIKHPSARLSENDALSIRRMSKDVSRKEIAGLFRISVEHVRDIINRKKWKHLPELGSAQ